MREIIPRELVAKLRSMTETIKMLSTENVALREENDGLVMMQGGTSGSSNRRSRSTIKYLEGKDGLVMTRQGTSDRLSAILPPS